MYWMLIWHRQINVLKLILEDFLEIWNKISINLPVMNEKTVYIKTYRIFKNAKKKISEENFSSSNFKFKLKTGQVFGTFCMHL